MTREIDAEFAFNFMRCGRLSLDEALALDDVTLAVFAAAGDAVDAARAGRDTGDPGPSEDESPEEVVQSALEESAAELAHIPGMPR